MNPLMTLFSSEYWNQILYALGILLLFIFFEKLFSRYIFHFLLNLMDNLSTEYSEKIIINFKKPLRYFIFVIGIYWALIASPIFSAEDILLHQIFRSAIIVIITWGLYNFEDAYSGLFTGFTTKLGVQFNDMILPLLSKSLRIITIMLSFTIIAKEWQYDINGFIAGLGLGGLAFALAAKDSLANIFGGVVIIMDKPFSVGDWIQTPNVEGTVEELSFRSTRVRTFAQGLVIIPNSILANDPITNWTKMGKRRLTFSIGVTYSTPKVKIEHCVEKIKSMLISHPLVHKETIVVTFDKFNSSSLDIYIYFFVNATTFEPYMNVKQDINYKILDIIEAEEVSIAFPSTSIYIEQ